MRLFGLIALPNVSPLVEITITSEIGASVAPTAKWPKHRHCAGGEEGFLDREVIALRGEKTAGRLNEINSV